jgi:tRNA/rRNA methyltransferase
MNFNVLNLVLIEPKCDHLSAEAIARSKHASSILRRAKLVRKDYLERFDYVIGTTAKLGTDYNLPRSPITPSQLAERIPNGNIALLFGREGSGLSNEEIRKCDFVVHIPTASKYPTLNISHAVSIILYELTKKKAEQRLEARFALASRKEKNLLLKRLDKILSRMDFATEEKRETQRLVWKRMINKSFLTRREAFALFGFFKKLKPKKI